MNKKTGVPRFSGRGHKKWDPRPGTVEWYKANMPERLKTTAINIRNGTGLPMEDQRYEGPNGVTSFHPGAETMAARVLAWNEKPLAQMKFDNKKCGSCGGSLEHTDKPFPKWDKTAR